MKYRPLAVKNLRPFVEVGFVPRSLSGQQNSSGYSADFVTGARTPFQRQQEWKAGVTTGIVTGGGVEFGGKHLRVAPELRYTRWRSEPFSVNESQGYQINGLQNQIDLMVGITWRK